MEHHSKKPVITPGPTVELRQTQFILTTPKTETLTDSSITNYLLPLDNQFSKISNFSEGLARVCFSYDGIGFINVQEEFSFKATYKEAGNFHSGIAWVMKEINSKNNYGFIDKTGKLVIPYRYDGVEDFSGNRALVYDKKAWMVINKQGKKVFGDALLNREAETPSGERYAVEPSSFHSNRLAVKRNGRYGYLDVNGDLSIPYQYDIALDFDGDVALVAKDVPYKEMGTNNQLPKVYKQLREGPTRRQWQIIDTTGKVLYTFKQNEEPEWQDGFSNGIIPFRVGRKMGFMNQFGKVIIPAKYGNNLYPFAYSDSVCIVQIRGQESDNSDGYMKVIDRNGNEISKVPFKTKFGLMRDSNHKFHEGLLAVQVFVKGQGLKWGYIDKQGDFVIPPIYELAMDFHDGRAVVKTPNGKVNYLINPLKKTRR